MYPITIVYNSNHTGKGKYSLILTISYSHVLLVLDFCFVDLACTTPVPKEIQPPVWPQIFGCIACAASIQLTISCNKYLPINISSVMVRLMKCSSLFRFLQSSTYGVVILVNIWSIASSMLVLSLWIYHIIFATIDWNISSFSSYKFSA